MEKPPPDFDLKLMPDWLKETPSKNPYADYEVRDERPRRDFGERPRAPREERRAKPRRDERSQGGDRRDGKSFPPQTREFSRPHEDAPRPSAAPAPVRIEFLPEPHFVASIARQAKANNRAYPLFDLARMFLEKPERHRVRVTPASEGGQLFQLGEQGPVALEAANLEKTAFNILKTEFYTEEQTQREPLKGNFSNVARCKLTGEVLGPTNHHGYQPAVRKLYEERFARRMSFADFQREIETVCDPAVVEKWKEAARNVTSFRTQKETEPLTFATAAEAEQHFRQNHLATLLRRVTAAEIPGEASRHLPDRGIANAVRQAWENERKFPAQLMHHLRQQLGQAGLHLFKHRKRVQFMGAVRPAPFKDKNFSPNIAEILRAIETRPRCTRTELAAAILPPEDDPALPQRKAALASDLHWLIDAGRVIEFYDGHFELPLEPKAAAAETPEAAPAQDSAPAPVTAAPASSESEAR